LQFLEISKEEEIRWWAFARAMTSRFFSAFQTEEFPFADQVLF
jgi:hypothetical protein